MKNDFNARHLSFGIFLLLGLSFTGCQVDPVAEEISEEPSVQQQLDQQEITMHLEDSLERFRCDRHSIELLRSRLARFSGTMEFPQAEADLLDNFDELERRLIEGCLRLEGGDVACGLKERPQSNEPSRLTGSGIERVLNEEGGISLTIHFDKLDLALSCLSEFAP